MMMHHLVEAFTRVLLVRRVCIDFQPGRPQWEANPESWQRRVTGDPHRTTFLPERAGLSTVFKLSPTSVRIYAHPCKSVTLTENLFTHCKDLPTY